MTEFAPVQVKLTTVFGVLSVPDVEVRWDGREAFAMNSSPPF